MKIVFSFLLITILLASCKDIFEEDIESKKFGIINPPDNYVSSNSTINFWWEELEGADNFNLQIVKGRFDNISQFILDSNIRGERFVYSFDPGNYQWRIKAQNSVSSTNFKTRSFQIDSTSDISQSMVILIAPLGNLTSNTTPTFRWNRLYNASSYVFEIRENDWLNGKSIFLDTLEQTSISLKNTLKDSTYSWGIRAFNQESETVFSTSTFKIDTQPPGMPVLQAPSNQTTTPEPGPLITFQWNSGTDKNIDFDSIYIYSNPSLTTIVNSAKVFDETYIDSLTAGTYYWRVKSIDKVGNIGSFSPDWVFRVN